MKQYTKIFAAACGLFSAGCQSQTPTPGEAAIPSDTFHLSVEHVTTHSEETVSLLKLRASREAFVHLDSAQFHHCGFLMASSPGEPARDGQITFSASRLAHEGDHATYIQTFMHGESSGNSVTQGPTLNPVPAATALDTYFSISATSGDYKLDTPMEIGRLAGKPITLTVGKSTQ